ncbi:MAG: tRNA glutamyl-Q(34) synthetase GluQRS [Devosia sp.]
MPSPVLRFAPSPNGYLHLGHAFSVLFTDFWAKRLGGGTLLRLEDTDPTRCKPEFAEAIIEDLHWLGLSWPEPVRVQSTRFAAYAAEADRLRDRGLLYPCICSRTEVAEHAIGTDPDGAPIYGGTCLHRPPAAIEAFAAEGGEPVQYRLHSAEAIALTGPLSFSVAGPTPMDRPHIRYARPELWGDFVVQRKGTPTSYHLSVVIDDADQAITHITRGRDMEAATDIHVLLQMLLGLPQPIYTFHKLILGEDGKKLAKSKGSPTLRSLREAGWTVADVSAAVGF